MYLLETMARKKRGRAKIGVSKQSKHVARKRGTPNLAEAAKKAAEGGQITKNKTGVRGEKTLTALKNKSQDTVLPTRASRGEVGDDGGDDDDGDDDDEDGDDDDDDDDDEDERDAEKDWPEDTVETHEACVGHIRTEALETGATVEAGTDMHSNPGKVICNGSAVSLPRTPLTQSAITTSATGTAAGGDGGSILWSSPHPSNSINSRAPSDGVNVGPRAVTGTTAAAERMLVNTDRTGAGRGSVSRCGGRQRAKLSGRELSPPMHSSHKGSPLGEFGSVFATMQSFRAKFGEPITAGTWVETFPLPLPLPLPTTDPDRDQGSARAPVPVTINVPIARSGQPHYYHTAHASPEVLRR